MGSWDGEVTLILLIASGSVSRHCLYYKRPEWPLVNGSKHKGNVLIRVQ